MFAGAVMCFLKELHVPNILIATCTATNGSKMPFRHVCGGLLVVHVFIHEGGVSSAFKML